MANLTVSYKGVDSVMYENGTNLNAFKEDNDDLMISVESEDGHEYVTARIAQIDVADFLDALKRLSVS